MEWNATYGRRSASRPAFTAAHSSGPQPARAALGKRRAGERSESISQRLLTGDAR